MAQKVVGLIKLQIPAGRATPAPPVGPALGQHGVNIMQFTKEFNERTKNMGDLISPVVITVYADRSFSFITKTPPAAVLIKKACNIKSGSGVPNKTKVAEISIEDVRAIAEQKMPDLNAASVEAAMSMIAGTARSMGERGEQFDYPGCSSENNVSFLLFWFPLQDKCLSSNSPAWIPFTPGLALHHPALLTVIPLDTLL